MSIAANERRPAAWLSARTASLAAVALAVAAVVLDAATPANYTLPVLHGVPLVLCVWVRRLWFLWILAVILVALTFVLPFWGPPPTLPESWTVVLVNRALAAFSTLLLAGIVHARILVDRTLKVQHLALEQQHAALEAANRELSSRDEEISRQNDELQAQKEELERQSEELRVTNEELVSREKTLEQLLELSRTLTGEFKREEMLARICEALGVLTNGLRCAILERRDQELHLTCHHGFGREGLEADTIPYAHSFASMIMSLGQTGYLEDIRLRPDLIVPQPRQGEPVRSVLSSPLRIRGQCIGTIEIYGSQRQPWSDAQVAMMESLAAQTSISLQSAELIEAIRRERRRFESAFRMVPFGMAVAEDPQGHRVRLNPAAAAMLNVARDEDVALSTPTGARLRRYFFRQDRPVAEEEFPLTRALRGEEILGEEFEVVFPTGKRLALLASAAPLDDAQGRTVGAVWAFADITTQKELQRELESRRREAEEASVRKTRFLASVSHDIRTPVNAINLMAEVIRRFAGNPALAGEIPELAQRLQANAHSLVTLVSDVLDIAHYDSGKVELQETDFLLNDLVAQECRQLQPLAEEKGLQLIVELPDRPLCLHADRVKLGRILANLIGNALKFTEQGAVRVRAALDQERRVLLRVSDTGIGIAPEDQQRIFDEFAQVHNPARDRTRGSGLGLAICKRLVEVMGGTLTVASDLNQGSSFTVTLPAASVLLRLDAALAPSRPLRRSASAGDLLSGIRILLVEDHPATRESAAHLLRGEGATVVEAADARSALQLLEQAAVDVLLLDMMLPDVDGREVLKALQAGRPAGLKGVLVLTGDLTSDRLEEVKRLGADALIGKPIDLHQLVATLRVLQHSV